MLLLYGEWLKAVGFPIGSAAFVTTDKRGELALHRIGLGGAASRIHSRERHADRCAWR